MWNHQAPRTTLLIVLRKKVDHGPALHLELLQGLSHSLVLKLLLCKGMLTQHHGRKVVTSWPLIIDSEDAVLGRLWPPFQTWGIAAR